MSVDIRRANPTRPELLNRSIISAGVAFILVSLWTAAGWWPVPQFDEPIGKAAHGFSAERPFVVDILEFFDAAFSRDGCTIMLALILAFFLGRREWRMVIWIIVSGLGTVLGTALLKQLFGRDRPDFEPTLHEISSFAYPSGHSSGAAMVATIAVLCTIVLTGRGWRRRVLIGVFVTFAALGGISRIFLGVHWTTDVIGGLLFGTLFTLVAWLLLVADRTARPEQPAAVTGTGGKRAAVILNPAKVGDVDGFKYRVLQVAAETGWSEPLWYETTVEDPGHGQTAAALAEEVDLIVAAGGDGTVRAVCEEAARTGVAVGILPHGTGNLLARNLNIPLNTRDALDVVFTGQDKAIDLANYTTDSGVDTTFLVMAGLGMDAAIMTGVNDQLKEKVGWLAYFVSGMKALRFPAMKVQISVDGSEFKKFRARTVVVGNVGFLQAGIPLLPDARIDDGALDVVVIAPKTFLGWLGIVARVMARQRRTNDRLDRLTGQRVVIRAERNVPMQLDGDAVGEGKEITAEVRHGVLLVRVPLTHAER